MYMFIDPASSSSPSSSSQIHYNIFHHNVKNQFFYFSNSAIKESELNTSRLKSRRKKKLDDINSKVDVTSIIPWDIEGS